MSVSARGEAIEPGTVQDGQKLNGQPFNGWSLVMQPSRAG